MSILNVNTPTRLHSKLQATLDAHDVCHLPFGPTWIGHESSQSSTPLHFTNDCSEECLFATEETVADIMIVAAEPAKLAPRCIPKDLKSMEDCLNLQIAPAVRLFVKYMNAESQQKIIMLAGSAFRISPMHFLTAEHVVRESMIDDTGEKYFLKSIELTANVDAKFTTATIHGTLSRCHHSYPMSNASDLRHSGTNKNLDIDNNFCILQLNPGSRVPDAVLPAIPTVSHTFNSGKSIVVGYPNFCLQNNFPKHIVSSSQNQDVDKLYLNVVDTTSNFEHKLLSICNTGELHKRYNNLMSHHCSTLPGTSGGLFLQMPPDAVSHTITTLQGHDVSADAITTLLFPKVPLFAGIHVGGDIHDGCNYAFLTSSPKFGEEYVKQVVLSQNNAVKQFVQLYSQDLVPFVKSHMNVLEQAIGPLPLQTIKDMMVISKNE